MKSKRKIAALVLCTALLTSALGGCGGTQQSSSSVDSTAGGASENTAQPAADGEKVTLHYLIFDSYQAKEFAEMDMVAQFEAAHPNITVEIEKAKDSAEMENSLKIRAASNQLPDLVGNKVYMLDRFKDYLVDLSDMELTGRCPAAANFAVDGKVLGIPDRELREFVFYWEDLFTQYGVSVPETWDEFIQTAQAIKEADPNMIPIALGAKDEWTTYPFMELMPTLVANDGFLWRSMGQKDTPFAEGEGINKSYHMYEDLVAAEVFGPDPMGIGYDQAMTLFSNKQAAMFVIAGWGMDTMRENDADLTTLKSFMLPVRESESDPFRIYGGCDNFMSIFNTSEHIEEAKIFMDWYYEYFFPDFIQKVDALSAISDVEKELHPVLQEALDSRPDAEVVMYDGGDDNFNNIMAETKFDYKKLGVEMLTPGFDLDKRLEELDSAWTKARSDLGIS